MRECVCVCVRVCACVYMHTAVEQDEGWSLTGWLKQMRGWEDERGRSYRLSPAPGSALTQQILLSVLVHSIWAEPDRQNSGLRRRDVFFGCRAVAVETRGSTKHTADLRAGVLIKGLLSLDGSDGVRFVWWCSSSRHVSSCALIGRRLNNSIYVTQRWKRSLQIVQLAVIEDIMSSFPSYSLKPTQSGLLFW